jgi:undecaprenyl-diphosphatase
MGARSGLLAAVFAVLFGTLLWVVMPAGHPVALDLDVARWISEHRSDAGVAFFTGLSFAGSVFGLVPIALVLAWWLRRRYGWAPVQWLAVTMVGATLLYVAVNVPIARPRPPMGMRIYEDAAWSFPSGHSTQAVAFWLVVASLVSVGRGARVRIVARAMAVVMIALIGFSRVYLCAHWTTDVLAGWALGAAWLAIVLQWRRRRTWPFKAGSASASTSALAA